MARLVDIQTLHARHADGAFVLDVREPAEYVTGHVPGAVLAPMSRITSALGPVPRDRVVHVDVTARAVRGARGLAIARSSRITPR